MFWICVVPNWVHGIILSDDKCKSRWYPDNYIYRVTMESSICGQVQRSWLNGNSKSVLPKIQVKKHSLDYLIETVINRLIHSLLNTLKINCEYFQTYLCIFQGRQNQVGPYSINQSRATSHTRFCSFLKCLWLLKQFDNFWK